MGELNTLMVISKYMGTWVSLNSAFSLKDTSTVLSQLFAQVEKNNMNLCIDRPTFVLKAALEGSTREYQ